MMSLREQIEEDVTIFFDLEEFAAEHILEGRTICAVVDNDQLQKNSLQAGNGLHEGDQLLFVRSADLDGLRIAPGVMITLDGRPYQVAELIEEDGVAQVTFNAIQGGF